jgi:hypothetical protein
LDRCDVDNHRIDNCSVTEHHLYNGSWNQRSRLIFYLDHWEALVWSLPHNHVETNRWVTDVCDTYRMYGLARDNNVSLLPHNQIIQYSIYDVACDNRTVQVPAYDTETGWHSDNARSILWCPNNVWLTMQLQYNGVQLPHSTNGSWPS